MSDYEIRNSIIEEPLREIGRMIGNQLPPNYGFTLFIYTFGEKGELFYISKARREDMFRMMKEFIAREEKENK